MGSGTTLGGTPLPREALLRLRGWIGTLGCWDGRDEVTEWLSLAGEASPSVVEIVGQRRVERELWDRFGLAGMEGGV